MGRLLILTLAASFVASAQLSPAEQAAVIEKTRTAGTAYNEQLKRFSASERKVRSAASVRDARKGKWKRLEIQESDLDFDAGKLKYRLLRVNGSDKNPQKRIKQGYLNSWGEFEVIRWVFAPERKAVLSWDRVEDGLCVLAYAVPKATSELIMHANESKVIFAYQGRMFVDCASGSISRVQVHTDPDVIKMGRSEIAVGVDLDVRYAPVEISGQTHLLPSEAVIIGQYDKTMTKAEMSFSGYRKYDASSSIVFGQP